MSINTSASFQYLKEWFDHSSLPSIKLWFRCQAFIQAVLLISIFEQRDEILNVTKCRWGFRGAAIAAMRS